MPFSEHMTAFAPPGRHTKRRSSRALVVIALVAGVVAVQAPPAQALFHLIKVREVYAGSADKPTSQFIELQMYSANQVFLAGHSVTVYDAAGTEAGSFTFTSAVENADDQAYVLLATPEAETEFGVTADLAMTAVLASGGGKVCFAEDQNPPVDCASWGTFSAEDSDAGTPFNSPIGLVPGQSMERKISRGEATKLDEPDDTNDSAADFQSSAPSPTNNAGDGGGGGGGEDPESHDRSVTLSLRRHLRARGTVASGGPESCVQEVPVRLQRRGASGWRTVKTVTTNSSGAYATTLKDRPGRYRATAPETSPSEADRCLAATSPVRRHSH